MATLSHFLTFLSALTLILTAHLSSPTPLHSPNNDKRAPPSPAAGIIPSLSGPPSFVGSGTYPRANRLRDGSLIATYTSFSSGQSTITIARSTNNGGSWSPIGSAASGATSSHDIDNPYILQLPSGRILVAFRNHDRNPNTGAYTFFRITVCASDDNGSSWSFLSNPASDPGGPTGNWEPFLRNANDGSLQLYYSRENNGGDQDTLERFSYDGGASWTGANTITGGDRGASRDGMVGVASISGNTLIAVFETEDNGGPFRIESVTSNDDGRSWGNRRGVYTPSRGNANAPQVVNVGGTLVTSFQTDEDGGQVAKVVTSGNGGNGWGNKVTFLGDRSSWPGVVAVDGGSLLALAENGGVKSQRIALR
ncbi:MAG: hypothetical protein Q9160_004394 [Pyrenula sp. 1 TL-2023]